MSREVIIYVVVVNAFIFTVWYQLDGRKSSDDDLVTKVWYFSIILPMRVFKIYLNAETRGR